jgi:hypothetical protein
MPSPIALAGQDATHIERALLDRLDDRHVMMMGDNPALPRMPRQPRLLDFLRLRMQGLTARHLLISADRARREGESDAVVMACLLHDIANGGLIRADHGYWGAQLIAPYVSAEIAFGVQYHQALRYFADSEFGYEYPESYHRFFGPDYQPPDYIRADADYARCHEYYRTARMVTVYDTYFFEQADPPDAEDFAAIIARNFREPDEGLGFDNSPSAHMWRTMIWPQNFL